MVHKHIGIIVKIHGIKPSEKVKVLVDDQLQKFKLDMDDMCAALPMEHQ